MPHVIRIRYDTTIDDGRISFSIGVTRFALKSRPTSLEVLPNISPAPDDAELKKSNAPLGLVMIEVPIWSVLKTRCPLMPHAIRIRLQTDIAEGLLSSEIGTTADESNRIAVNGKYSLPGSSFIAMSPMISSGNAPVAVFQPYPVKPLLLQGSLLPISPLMPHHVTIFEILLLMPLLVLRRYLTVVLISAWPRRSWRNLRSRHLS